MDRRATEEIQRVASIALKLLQRTDLVSAREIATKSERSEKTAKRAIGYLREAGAEIRYMSSPHAYKLISKGFALPLAEPTEDDLQAVLVAAGLLAELGHEGAARRARSLFDALEKKLRAGGAPPLQPESLRVTQTTSPMRRPALMLTLLRAAGRSVVRIRSVSVWTRKTSTHQFEPWHVWIHDGIAYVRGYSRTRDAARTFGLANIQSVEVEDGVRPRAPVPPDPWSGEDPRFGVDDDRPDTATIRFHGPIVHWVASLRWHERQEDEWLIPDKVLERKLPYRSCRELARRLASFGDGLREVYPAQLRAEIERVASAAAAACTHEASSE